MYSDVGFVMQMLDTHVRLLRSSLLYVQTGDNEQVVALAANIIRNSPAQIGVLLTIIATNYESLSADSDGPYYASY